MSNLRPPQITMDTELAKYFSPEMGDAYREGVEFMNALPSHALVRFRDALEFLCQALARQSGRASTAASLKQLIDKLLDAGVITFALKDCFHSIRKSCNFGAHRAAISGPEKLSEDGHSDTDILIAKALSARAGLFDAMQMLSHARPGLDREILLKEEVIDVQDWKALVFQAFAGESPEDKYKAGLWCESQADKMLRSIKELIVSEEFEMQYRFLMRTAAIFHQASYHIKPNVDAMFRYASFVARDFLDGDKKNEAAEIIRKAADQGHGQACEHYGSILYEDRQDMVGAEKYWLRALDKGCVRAYYCLGLFYKTDGLGKPDLDKAISFFQQGAAEDDRDSLGMLGQCYFEGIGVLRDVEKARHFLTRAASLGNTFARNYLMLKVNGGEEKLLEGIRQYGMMLAKSLPLQKPVKASKTRVNDRCPCGSGMKYKKCHGAP